jgi:predicted MFS family arabinose efflux permease
MFSYFYFATLLYQDALGFSALQTGLSFLPFTVAILIGGSAAPRLVAMLGERLTVILGISLAAVGIALFAIVAPGDPSGFAGLVPALILGFGPPLFFTVATSRVMSTASNDDAGAAASLLQSFQQLGAAIGIAGLTTVYVAAAPELGGAGAITVALFVSVGVALVLIIVSLATRAYPR